MNHACLAHNLRTVYERGTLLQISFPVSDLVLLSITVYRALTAAGRGQGERYETCVNVVQEALPIALARPYSQFVLPPGTKVKHYACMHTYV
jgi:hypothetical protein